MPTAIVFKCDTCDREIQIPQNKKGLDTVGSCVITTNCKGHLFQIGKKENVLQIPIPVPEKTGLQDWIPRKLLFNFEQLTPQRQWTVTHNLGVKPSLQTFINVDGSLEEVTPLEINHLSAFTTIITFSNQQSGIVQCIARSTSTLTPQSIVALDPEPTFIQIMTGNELTLATIFADTELTLGVTFLNPDNFAPLGAAIPVKFTIPVSFLSAWKEHQYVFFNDRLFTVRSANMQEVIATNQIPNNAAFYFSTPSALTYILLSKSPFTNNDKDANNILDLSLISTSSSPELVYQNSGVMYCDTTLIKSVYPPVRKFS